MPTFNLVDDVEADGFDFPVSIPINADEASNVNAYQLSLEGGQLDSKKLVISYENSFHVTAMLPGVLIAQGSMLRLDTTVFYQLAPIASDQSSWFRQWIDAGCIPLTILYEGLVPSSSLRAELVDGIEVSADTVIGETLSNTVKISVNYGSTSLGTIRSMHPVELLSLLFWKENCDTLFRRDSADSYTHPLLQRLNQSIADGSTGSAASSNWLGLRPPLRTYKRLEWEARQTHIYHHWNWQRLPTEPQEREEALRDHPEHGDLTDILRNPMAFDGYERTTSKCNIFIGDIAFRAGFRTTTGQSSRNSARPLTYVGVPPLATVRGQGERSYAQFARREVSWQGRRYQRTSPFGIVRTVTDSDRETITNEIQQKGHILYYARKGCCQHRVQRDNLDSMAGQYCPGTRTSGGREQDTDTHQYKIGHVFLMSTFGGIAIRSDGQAQLRSGTSGLDQHCRMVDNMPNAELHGIALTGSAAVGERAFVELLPGGDPTEQWGVLNLNCLTEVTDS